VLNNFGYKSLADDELSYIFKGIDFPLRPMRHQQISMAFAAKRNRVAFLHDVGTGKTLTSLYTLKLWGCRKTLIICPSSAFSSWRRDLENYTDYSFTFLTGEKRDRLRKLKKSSDIFIIHYEGLKTIYGHLVAGVTCRGKVKRSWQMDIESFVHNFDCIILDEVHKCKNYDSLQTKICLELSKRAEHLIGLTGTPIDKSYIELFSIYKTIDLGKSLGVNFFAYRFRHFNKKLCGTKWRHWNEWKLKDDHEQIILDRISDVTLHFSREECFELPPLQEIIKYLHPSKRFLELQKAVITNRPVKSQNQEVLIKKCMKAKAQILRELPNGFFYYGKDGEDRKVYRLKKNPKIEALLDLLEDTHSKVIVFYWYTEEHQILEEALQRAKIPFCSVFGGQDHVDREKEIIRFSNDKDVRVLLSQIVCSSEGFDAFVANIIVFFSPLSSPKMRKQCIGRAHRKGQKRKVLVIDFVLEQSIEERIVDGRGERFDLVAETMRYISDFHKGLKNNSV